LAEIYDDFYEIFRSWQKGDIGTRIWLFANFEKAQKSAKRFDK
jgi:hypothetical protein